MRPLPLDTFVLPDGSTITRIGDPLQDMAVVEYIVEQTGSGGPNCSAMIGLDDDDRRILAEGGFLQLTMYGGELPWSIDAIERTG